MSAKASTRRNLITQGQAIAAQDRNTRTYSQDEWTHCHRIVLAAMHSGHTVRQTLAMPDMPSRNAYYQWLHREGNETFLSEYHGAREAFADAMADEVLDVSDTARDADTASAARVRADARKWLAAKLRPQVYGDNVGLALSGSGGLQITLGRFDPSPQAPAQTPAIDADE
jgi:hypothetical protein